MELLSAGGLWPWGAAGGLLTLLVFRRPLGFLIRLALRSAVGYVFLLLWGKIGLLSGLALGANWFNALILGVLGTPGFGLLLLLHWLTLP